MRFVFGLMCKKLQPAGCGPGYRQFFGYGRILLGGKKGKTFGAHRISWFLAHGPIPDGLSVLHRCDNPPCVNPDHLFLGTQADNLRDMGEKRRSSPQTKPELFRGSNNGRAKLNEQQVRDIRAMDESLSNIAIAKQFGVSDVAIAFIRLGRTWKCVA